MPSTWQPATPQTGPSMDQHSTATPSDLEDATLSRIASFMACWVRCVSMGISETSTFSA